MRKFLVFCFLAATFSEVQSQELLVDQIQADAPIAHWSFNEGKLTPKQTEFTQQSVGATKIETGPRQPEFPLFSTENAALQLNAKSYLRIKDPGTESPFDFEAGDAITIEAFVAPKSIPGTYAYIVGKGRTYLPKMVKENHNWSLRLKKVGGAAAISFLFRGRGKENEYHRWESSGTLAVGDGWHHVAITYVFGSKGSIRGYIDGQPVKGKWDLGGDTERAPMVNNDEVWVGSAMGGNKTSSFNGSLDEIAIYRKALDAKRIANRYQYNTPPLPPVTVPENKVLVQIFEKIPNDWQFRSRKFTESFTSDVFAFPELPKRYNERGVQVARPTPFLLQAYADTVIPKGKHRLLFRSREASRLYIDGELVGETDFYKITGDANGPVWDLDRSHGPNIRPLQRGDRQKVVEFQGDGKSHRIRLDVLVGLKGRRREMGDASVSIAKPTGDFQIISFAKPFELTIDGWDKFREWQRKRLIVKNKHRRDQVATGELQYWDTRHELARSHIRKSNHDATLSIDAILDQTRSPEIEKSPRLDDLAFLRRLSLDTIGTIPTREQIKLFLADPPSTRRAMAIDRLINSEGWADHWVGYWQDVLAENPNIVNPTLNNTGPFRWWILESFLENKPFDRFVTELIMMDGSPLEGAPAGFELASANDVPMAAKSHLLGQAFLGVQMKCARCHDAPSHDIVQKDLFSIAAMLKRAPEQVPKTSSIDLPPEEIEKMLVSVTLKPGSKVQPEWPFTDLANGEIPEEVIRDPDDTRERLAAIMTSPANNRFAEVLVNRLWQRYLGHGLVESTDDWENSTRTNPELLTWLSKEFVANGYDIKHIAKRIFSSEVYQRQAVNYENADQFAGPQQRSLSAEQLVDSMFVASGKPYNAGTIAFDIDGARPAKLSLNLGSPRRAWMFTSTSNERDRPGLAMPFAEPFVTFMEQFGWRGARQNPISVRPDDLTALQPAEFANGVLARRTCRLSDDNELTELALQENLSIDQLVDELYLRMFTRSPTDRESKLIKTLLADGFDSRRKPNEPITKPAPDRRGTISWSNHLEQEATTIKNELEQVVRAGDPPTRRLDADWRERMEDVVWSMMNSPEFRFSP